MDIPIPFGRFLVRQGRLSEEELAEIIRVQAEINQSFATTALEDGYITLDQFKEALNYQREKGVSFKEALRELNIVDEATIEKIEEAVMKKYVRLGELIVKRGIMTDDELRELLKEFKEKGKISLL